MTTMRVEQIIRRLCVDRRTTLKRILEAAEREGITDIYCNDSVGRLASEGFISVRKDGTVELRK